eukprot:4807703-Pyramimonas_sp.AAC.3
MYEVGGGRRRCGGSVRGDGSARGEVRGDAIRYAAMRYAGVISSSATSAHSLLSPFPFAVPCSRFPLRLLSPISSVGPLAHGLVRSSRSPPWEEM